MDAARTLVIGHSEGGIVAAYVAAKLPKVTHVASLAGGGPTQLFDFVSNDEDKKVLELHFKQTILGRPFMAAPSLPKERLATLRKAFLDTMKDREFLADTQKMNLDIDIATAEEVDQLLKEFVNYPRNVIAKARAAIGR